MIKPGRSYIILEQLLTGLKFTGIKLNSAIYRGREYPPSQSFDITFFSPLKLPGLTK